jgi:hypothetical protein
MVWYLVGGFSGLLQSGIFCAITVGIEAPQGQNPITGKPPGGGFLLALLQRFFQLTDLFLVLLDLGLTGLDLFLQLFLGCFGHKFGSLGWGCHREVAE